MLHLLFVLSALARRGWPRGNDANEFSTTRSRDDEYSSEYVHSQRHVTLLCGVRVIASDGVRIVEDADGVRKIDSVLAAICRRFPKVPLEGHSVICMHKCAPMQALRMSRPYDVSARHASPRRASASSFAKPTARKLERPSIFRHAFEEAPPELVVVDAIGTFEETIAGCA